MKQVLFIAAFIVAILLVRLTCDTKWHLKAGSYRGSVIRMTGEDKLSVSISGSGTISGTADDGTNTGTFSGTVSQDGDISGSLVVNGSTSILTCHGVIGKDVINGEGACTGAQAGRVLIQLNRTGD